MTNKLMMILTGIIFCGLLLGSSAMAEDEVVKWRLQGITPPSDVAYMQVVKFCDSVKEKSGGKFIIKAHPGNTLVKTADSFRATQKGMLDMMYSAGSYWSGILAEGNWETGLPYTTRNRAEEMALLYDYGLLKILREAYAEKGMYLLSPGPCGKRIIMSNKPIRKIEDFKGLKIRCTGPEADLVKLLGASPVFLTGGEIYTALELGTVDAASWTSIAWSKMNWSEVAKYYCKPRTADMNLGLVVNKKKYDALPEKYKIILDLAAREWIDNMMINYHEIEVLQEKKLDLKRLCVLSPEDQAKVQKMAIQVWDKIAKMSPRNAEAVKIIKAYMKKLGRI